MFARVMVGILFFMAGWWKCFELTPMAHARGMFVEGFAETWIPAFLLWGLGLAIPVVELVAGALLIVGWRTKEALITIGVVLLIVTYGLRVFAPEVAWNGTPVYEWVRVPAWISAVVSIGLLLRHRGAGNGD